MQKVQLGPRAEATEAGALKRNGKPLHSTRRANFRVTWRVLWQNYSTPMKTCILLSAVILGAFAATATAANDAGFQPLFNGEDLTGWRGNPDLWSVENGTIKGVTKADPKLTHNTFLVWTNGTVDNFELRLSYKIVNGNSGIQYRSKVLREGAQGPVVGGYQADFEAGQTYSGILYEEQGRGILAQRGQKTVIKTNEADPKKPRVEVTGSVGESKAIQANIKKEDWNDYVVVARGNHLQHFINGMPTVDVVDEDEAKAAKSGVLALQIHTGPPMTVQFKDIRLKKLGKDSAGLLQKMAGKWVPVEATYDGEPVDKDRLESILLTIEGNKYTSKSAERVDEGTLEVDESKSPARLEVQRTNSNGEKQTIPAICEVKDDSMRICYGWNTTRRPQEFKSEADSGVLLVSYKRE